MSLIRLRNNNLFPAFRNMENLFDQFFFNDAACEAPAQEGFMPALNLSAEGEEIVISAELPGLKPEDVTLNLENGVLTLSGEKHADAEEKEDEKKRYYRVERRWGKFTRKVKLPTDVDTDKVQALFENGVLEIRIPKLESAKPKQISIETR